MNLKQQVGVVQSRLVRAVKGAEETEKRRLTDCYLGGVGLEVCKNYRRCRNQC